MFSGYSVIKSANYLPSDGYSSDKHQAVIVRKRQMSPENRNQIANLTDDEIILTSLEYAEKKTNKTVAGKLANALPSLFVTAVPLVFGALHKGSLSSKMKTAFSTALIFGGTFALFDKYNKGMDRVENASKKIEKERKEHPVAAAIFDFAAKGMLFLGASVALIKGGNFLQNKFRPTADKLSESIVKTSEIIDNSRLGRGIEKLNTKTDGFLNKHPKLSKFLSKNAFLAPALTLLGWIGFENIVINKTAKNTYNYASQMSDVLLAERENARIT